MSRTRKLLIVSLVLAVGIGLSLPFRKSGTIESNNLAERVVAMKPAEANHQSTASVSTPPDRHNVVAQMTGTSEPTRPVNSVPPAASFDLANHPAFVNAPPITPTKPAVSPQPFAIQPQPSQPTENQSREPRTRPAYQTVENLEDEDNQWPREIVHIVQDGDTLERLARRYLGDEGRALEIFDMNRDKLTNPHQLPINAELRVPVAPGRLLD